MTATAQESSRFRLLEATIDSIHGAMRAGQLSSRQLVQLYLARINAYDHQAPALNSIQTINPAALEEADRLDAQLSASGPAGPLHGIPVMVKDQVETSDMPTSYGSALFKDFVPHRNATVVAKLKAAGAIILAKNTMSEYAVPGYHGSAFGFTRNPYDPARSPGGSSCGTGVAIAANFGVVGVGEDTGGSIRNPAAFNSLVALRPTMGLVSRFGMLPGSPSRDTLGPMARTVRDAAILLDVLAGYDPNDPLTAYGIEHIPQTYTGFLTPDGLTATRLGIIREPLGTTTDTEAEDYRQIRTVIDRAVGDMAARGAKIVDPVPVASVRDLLRRPVGSGETEAAINLYLAAHPNAPVSTLRAIVIAPDALVLPSQRAQLAESLGRTANDPEYLQALLTRDALRREVLKTMADYALDALVYATYDHAPLPIPADILTASRVPRNPGGNSALSPALGFPALTVPAGFTADGLPVGMSLLGRPFSEGVLFEIAYAYEKATLHRQPPRTTPAVPGEP